MQHRQGLRARASLEVYVAGQAVILAEASGMLVLGGSLCWQVDNYVEAGETPATSGTSET